jgi:hypothetical protein
VSNSRFLDNPGDHEALATVIREARLCGWDTETYGHNVRESTPAFRAKIDEWSLAVRLVSAPPTARGYRPCVGFALPLSALLSGPLRAVLEDPIVVKVAHNARHDVHAAANYGVVVRSVRDTLDLARLVYPHLKEFNLKALRQSALGKPVRDTFRILTEDEVTQVPVPYLACLCGKPGCRRSKRDKKTGEEHRLVGCMKYKTVKVPVGIQDIVPGHKRQQAKIDYMVDDAVDGLELDELLEYRLTEMSARVPVLPW